MFPFQMQQISSTTNTEKDIFIHADSIHHVEFDFYGQRIATVSSDKTVCIWDKSEDGSWRKTASWKVCILFFIFYKLLFTVF